MIEYCKGKPQDIEDIVDFANYVFSQSYAPHDFKKLLPKVYSDSNNTAQHHYLVKDNGKIKAMALSYPSELKVCDTVLKISNIGTVSVHPYQRGSGYMKNLLNSAMEDTKANGCHISVLSGQRQRYEYFGYEPCGIQADFTVTASNVKHAYKSLDCDNISIEAVEREDSDTIKKIYSLSQQQQLIGIRSLEEFYDIALSWSSKLYALKCSGEFLGYVIIGGNFVSELFMYDISKLPYILKAIITSLSLDEICVQCSLMEQDKITYLSSVCEGYRVECNHSFKIFDYQTVIKAFMELKATYANMPDGETVIKVENENLNISVFDNKISVEKTDKKADAEFTDLEAMTHIFSPVSELLKAKSKLPEPAKAWFPLPLFIPSADCC